MSKGIFLVLQKAKSDLLRVVTTKDDRDASINRVIDDIDRAIQAVYLERRAVTVEYTEYVILHKQAGRTEEPIDALVWGKMSDVSKVGFIEIMLGEKAKSDLAREIALTRAAKDETDAVARAKEEEEAATFTGKATHGAW